MLQASIDDAYAQFVDAVTQGRGLARDKVTALADGRIFTGRQAMQAGLVDEMGDYQDALEVATKLAHLAPHPPLDTDTSKSLMALVKHLSGQSKTGLFESAGASPLGFSLEYRLQ